MNRYINSIEEIIEKDKGNRWNIAKHVYNMLVKSNEDEGKILRTFFEVSEYNSILREGVNSGIEEEKYNQLMEDIEKTGVGKRFDQLLASGVDEKTFYDQLWMLINDSKSLRRKEQRQFMLFYIWHSSQIPYYLFANGITMPSEEYVKICEEIKEDITKVRFILFSRYSQRTEEGGYLLDLINKQDSDKKKAVLIANIARLVEVRLMTYLQKKGHLKTPQ